MVLGSRMSITKNWMYSSTVDLIVDVVGFDHLTVLP